MGSFVSGFLVGAVAGLGSALLQAPRPGRETQAAIRGGVESVSPAAMRLRAGEWLDEVVNNAEVRRVEIEDTLAGLMTSMMEQPAAESNERAWNRRAEVRQQVSTAVDQLLALGRSVARDLKEKEAV